VLWDLLLMWKLFQTASFANLGVGKKKPVASFVRSALLETIEVQQIKDVRSASQVSSLLWMVVRNALGVGKGLGLDFRPQLHARIAAQTVILI
jgi:hypothetical protein